MPRSMLIACIAVVAVASACTGSPPSAARQTSSPISGLTPSADPTASPQGADSSPRLDRYAPLIRGLARMAAGPEQIEQLIVRTEICATADDPPFLGERETCRDTFTPAERSALIERLGRFSADVGFVEGNPLDARLTRRGIVVWVGTAERRDGNLWIGGGLWRGGYGEGGTYVVKRRGGRWVFEGIAPEGSSWIT